MRGAVSCRNETVPMSTGAARASVARKIERQPNSASMKPPMSGATMGDSTITMAM